MLRRLVDQLLSCGADVVVDVPEPLRGPVTAQVPAGASVVSGAALPAATGRILVLGASVVAHTAAIDTLARDIRLRSGSLPCAALLVDESPEMLRAAVAAAGAGAVATGGPVLPELPELPALAIDGYVWRVVDDDSSARRAMADVRAVDEDAVRLRRAVKSDDGLFTTYAVSPWSRYLARAAARRGLTPNQVTGASMAVGAVAAGCFAVGTRPWDAAGAVLLMAAFALDCVDGQLARYTLTFSALGAWLDATFDRVKEYLAYAGIAVGAQRSDGADGTDLWALAVAAMVLQTVRHQVDLSYAAAGGADAARGTRVAALSARTSRNGPLYWAKRVVVLPIGERFAVLCLTLVLAGPRATFVVLLAWGSLAGAYTLSGRVLRSVAA